MGCGSATPTLRHNPSAQVVNMRDKLSLVDCGEGTQLQMRARRVKFMALRNVFISHLHGDHCLGLAGLIATFGLLGRTKNFHVYSPEGLEGVLRAQVNLFCHKLGYEVVYHTVDTSRNALVYEDRTMEVWSLPLKHTAACCGFLFKEKPSLPHINREMTDFYNIPVCRLPDIKAGKDWICDDGTVVPNARLVTPAASPRSYAYCSDTSYLPGLADMVRGVDLLYHEATYPDGSEVKAGIRGHSTAGQAAAVAKLAGVKRLMIGHYSATVDDVSELVSQACRVFPSTIAAEEGLVVNV